MISSGLSVCSPACRHSKIITSLLQDGFILEDNRWDSLLLDPVLSATLNLDSHKQETLETEGYLG